MNAIKHLRPKANPILVKELRSRMRGARAFIILTAALLILALISYALYQLVLVTSAWNYSPLGPQIGQTLFIALAVFEMLLICLITPAVTAGTISGEHENLTYEMLLTTPLEPARILWGKLISALSYVFLLIFAAIPMASLVFTYGGVSLRDMTKALVMLVCTAVLVGTIGIFTSTWLKRSARATVISYLIVLLMLGAPTLIYGIVALFHGGEPPRWILVPSPMSALFSAIAPSTSLGNSSLGLIGGFSMLMAGNIGVFSTNSIPRPLYHYTLPLYGIITMVLYFLAARMVRPARRWRIRTKELLASALVLLIFAGIVATVFIRTSTRYENISIFTAPTPFTSMPAEPMTMPAITPELDSSLPPSDGTDSDLALSADEIAQIYTAAIRQIYTVDTPIPGIDVPQILIVQKTVLAHTPAEIPLPVQNLVIANLEGMPFTLTWIEGRDYLDMEANGAIEGGSALIEFGEPVLRDDGRIEFLVNFHFNDDSKALVTYLLENIPGSGWQIVEFGGYG